MDPKSVHVWGNSEKQVHLPYISVEPFLGTQHTALGERLPGPLIGHRPSYLLLAERFQAHLPLCVYSSWASPLLASIVYLYMARPIPTIDILPASKNSKPS